MTGESFVKTLEGYPVFHAKDGLYFARTPDGIHVAVTSASRADSPVVREIVMSVDTFASVIASLSEKGEDAYTFTLVRALLASLLPRVPAQEAV